MLIARKVFTEMSDKLEKAKNFDEQSLRNLGNVYRFY